jgi:hypothetical protein
MTTPKLTSERSGECLDFELVQEEAVDKIRMLRLYHITLFPCDHESRSEYDETMGSVTDFCAVLRRVGH